MTFLKWKTEAWETNSHFLCRWFGHKWYEGWWGYKPYLRPGNVVWDNLDEAHIDLKATCLRCGKSSTVGFTHASPILRRLEENMRKTGRQVRRYNVVFRSEEGE